MGMKLMLFMIFKRPIPRDHINNAKAFYIAKTRC